MFMKHSLLGLFGVVLEVRRVSRVFWRKKFVVELKNTKIRHSQRPVYVLKFKFVPSDNLDPQVSMNFRRIAKRLTRITDAWQAIGAYLSSVTLGV